MANPLSSNLRPNALITTTAIKYTQTNPDLSMPGIISVVKRSDKYRVWDPADAFRSEMQKRAAGTAAAMRGVRLSTDQYYCDKFSLKRALPTENISEYGSIQEAETEIGEDLAHQALLAQAVEFASAFMVATPWAVNTVQTGVAAAPGADQFLQWNDAASTPIEDILARRESVHRACGFYPNTFVVGPDVALRLARHPDVLEIVKYTGTTDNPAVVSDRALAAALKVERVVVAAPIQNTAAEGQAATNADIVGKVALLAYFTEGPGKNLPSAGKIFAWQEFGGYPGNMPTIKRWFDDDLDSWMYEVNSAFDAKVTAAAAGQFFASAVA